MPVILLPLPLQETNKAPAPGNSSQQAGRAPAAGAGSGAGPSGAGRSTSAAAAGSARVDPAQAEAYKVWLNAYSKTTVFYINSYLRLSKSNCAGTGTGADNGSAIVQNRGMVALCLVPVNVNCASLLPCLRAHTMTHGILPVLVQT
jgi:hypothetical protein